MRPHDIPIIMTGLGLLVMINIGIRDIQKSIDREPLRYAPATQGRWVEVPSPPSKGFKWSDIWGQKGATQTKAEDVIVGWQKFNPLDHVPDTVVDPKHGSCSWAVKALVIYRMNSGAHVYGHARPPGPDSMIWCWPDKPGGEMVIDMLYSHFEDMDADYSIDLTGKIA